MGRIRATVGVAMADVSRAAIEGKNTAVKASQVCDKVQQEGITVTVFGIPIGVQLGNTAGESGPILKKLLELLSSEESGPIIKRLRKLLAEKTEA